MRHILSGVAPQTAPMEEREFYLDHSGEYGPHYHDDNSDALDRVLTELQVRDALPIYGDSEWDSVHNASTLEEVASAYRSIMIRRLGIPAWFAMMMTFTGMVDTWSSALANLALPSGEPLLRIDEALFVKTRVYESVLDDGHYYDVAMHHIPNPEFIEAYDVWGDGPLTLAAVFPLFLLRLEEPCIYYMHIGDMGNPSQMSLLSRKAGEGPAVKAFMMDPISRLTQMKLDEFSNAGMEWDIHYNLAR